MNQMNGFFTRALVAGIWTLVALQVTSIGQTNAQENPNVEQERKDTQKEITVIHATDIVGLSAMIEKSFRDHQFRPQSMPG